MDKAHSSAPVIVGVDGSPAAIHAAKWATVEALHRGVPLRLVSVIKSAHATVDEYYDDVHHAEASLRAARTAVEALGTPVEIRTDRLDGPPGATLIAESRDATMVCVGCVGIGRYARSILGSTATELAEKAHCPVAVVRSYDEQEGPDPSWIVVAVNDAPDNAIVVDWAMEEAEMRRSPVLAVGEHSDADRSGEEFDREVNTWKQHHHTVHVFPITEKADTAHLLQHYGARVQLAVIGAEQAGELDRIVGPNGHRLFPSAQSSALIVRR